MVKDRCVSSTDLFDLRDAPSESDVKLILNRRVLSVQFGKIGTDSLQMSVLNSLIFTQTVAVY